MPATIIYSANDQPTLSVIIPSLDGYRDGNVDALVECLKRQSYRDIEIIVAVGEKPNGHARNVGFEKSNKNARYLVFFDDDVLIDDLGLLNKFVTAMNIEEYGLVGASQQPPKGSNWIQKWIAYDLAKASLPVQSIYLETEMVTHAGMGCRRSIWEIHTGEDSKLVTGTDTDLRQRIRNSGFKVVIVPQTVVFHPLPKNIYVLLKSAYHHGWYQFDYRKKHGFQTHIWSLFPKLNIPMFRWFLILREMLLFFPHIFIANRSPILGFRPLNALFRVIMAFGYVSRCKSEQYE